MDEKQQSVDDTENDFLTFVKCSGVLDIIIGVNNKSTNPLFTLYTLLSNESQAQLINQLQESNIFHDIYSVQEKVDTKQVIDTKQAEEIVQQFVLSILTQLSSVNGATYISNQQILCGSAKDTIMNDIISQQKLYQKYKNSNCDFYVKIHHTIYDHVSSLIDSYTTIQDIKLDLEWDIDKIEQQAELWCNDMKNNIQEDKRIDRSVDKYAWNQLENVFCWDVKCKIKL